MKNAAVILIVAILAMLPQAGAQNKPANPAPVSIWSVHSPDIVVARRTVYPLAALTPPRPLVIRRLEAISNRGPLNGLFANGEPVPCPVQYVIEISNGVTSQQIPISNVFLNKETSQTYTDSGPLALAMASEKRITVTLLPPPKQQYPPVSCSIEGLNITIQYTAAEAPASSAENR